jgi:hypothetical protein
MQVQFYQTSRTGRMRIAPKVLLPEGGKIGEKDTLRQKWVFPWAEWIKP